MGAIGAGVGAATGLGVAARTGLGDDTVRNGSGMGAEVRGVGLGVTGRGAMGCGVAGRSATAEGAGARAACEGADDAGATVRATA